MRGLVYVDISAPVAVSPEVGKAITNIFTNTLTIVIAENVINKRKKEGQAMHRSNISISQAVQEARSNNKDDLGKSWPMNFSSDTQNCNLVETSHGYLFFERVGGDLDRGKRRQS